MSKAAKTHTATALVSVTDKAGLPELAAALADAGLAIIASSGTKTFLEEKGIAVREISDYTKSPEILGGRVKTLHPKIHGGILADRDNPDHVRTLDEQATHPIDFVVVNLYPFEEKFKAGLSPEQLIEFIDIGGITLIRAAAKNHKHVTVLTHPSQYAAVIAELKASGATSPATRARLAAEAFALTATYDAAIAQAFRGALVDRQAAGTPSHRVDQGDRRALRRKPAPARCALSHRGRFARGGHDATPGQGTLVQ